MADASKKPTPPLTVFILCACRPLCLSCGWGTTALLSPPPPLAECPHQISETAVADNLPNRDCDSTNSRGEICCYTHHNGTCDLDNNGTCAEGLTDYKNNYVDVFAAILAEYPTVSQRFKPRVHLSSRPRAFQPPDPSTAHYHCTMCARTQTTLPTRTYLHPTWCLSVPLGTSGRHH